MLKQDQQLETVYRLCSDKIRKYTKKKSSEQKAFFALYYTEIFPVYGEPQLSTKTYANKLPSPLAFGEIP